MSSAVLADGGAADDDPEKPIPEPLDDVGNAADDDEDDEDDEQDEQDDEDDDESSCPNASELEEEAQYEDQPACGLSPRLVVRRACETLTANDPVPAAGDTSLRRVDTMADFERAVGNACSPAETLTSPTAKPLEPKPLERIETMSGLVRQFFSRALIILGPLPLTPHAHACV